VRRSPLSPRVIAGAKSHRYRQHVASTRRLPVFAVALLLIAGCGADNASPIGQTLNETSSWTSGWFSVGQGAYGLESRNSPLGCLHEVALVGLNGYHVISVHPNAAPHAPPGYRGGAAWGGLTGHLVGGTYRIEGSADPGCTWSVRFIRE
jgi:hypothetical protein